MGEFHEHYDLLVTPTLPIPAFEAGVEVPAGSTAPRWTSWTPFTYPFNMTQQPAASVPCGFTTAGLPVGLQVVGPQARGRAGAGRVPGVRAGPAVARQAPGHSSDGRHIARRAALPYSAVGNGYLTRE